MIIKDLTNFMHTFFFQSNFHIRLQKLVIQLVEAIDSVTVLVNNEIKRASEEPTVLSVVHQPLKYNPHQRGKL